VTDSITGSRPDTVPAAGEETAALAREQFDALAASPGIVYLDSAATTQKPRRVIDAVTAHLTGEAANPGRGAYPWSTRAERTVAEVRERTARFIAAEGSDEIVFTAGATAGLNAVALSWGLANLGDGDEILFSPLDHSSNVYPWLNVRQVLARLGRRVTLVPYAVTAAGEADTADILAKVSPRTRLVTATHVHNVFGSMTTLEELGGRLGSAVRLCLDCSQSVGHVPVDMTRLGCDFAVFSGHKMFGIPGTGVAYFRRRVHPELAPFLPGGGTDVRLAGGALRELRMPEGMEGGTPGLTGIIALGAAMDFIDDLGIERIAAHGQALTRFLVDRLREVPGLRLLPGVAWSASPAGYGIVSFTVDGVRSDDLGFALSSKGFYVRTGSHCLAAGSGYEDSVRVSVHVYNSGQELARFADLVSRLVEGAI
jgi:cysteine desulfurase / selenocysteine lyase